MPGRRAVLAVLVLAFAGAAHAGAPASPCSLATVAQVKAAFGGAVSKGRAVTDITGAATCHFKVKHSNLGLSGEAVVFTTSGQNAAMFRIARKEVPGAVTVKGVGTAAFYNPHTNAVELLKGNTVASAQGVFLAIGGPQPNAAKFKADVVALAKAVAGHL